MEMEMAFVRVRVTKRKAVNDTAPRQIQNRIIRTEKKKKKKVNEQKKRMVKEKRSRTLRIWLGEMRMMRKCVNVWM